MNSNDLKEKFENKWGMFRKFIASKPLTGFWIGVGAGFVISRLLGIII